MSKIIHTFYHIFGKADYRGINNWSIETSGVRYEALLCVNCKRMKMKVSKTN